MTDAQIKLYAALRVAVPPGWRIRTETASGSFFATMIRVRFTARLPYRLMEVGLLVPEGILEHYTRTTIGLAVAKATTDIQRAIKRDVAAHRP